MLAEACVGRGTKRMGHRRNGDNTDTTGVKIHRRQPFVLRCFRRENQNREGVSDRCSGGGMWLASRRTGGE